MKFSISKLSRNYPIIYLTLLQSVINVNAKLEKETENKADQKREYGYLITVESKGYALPPRILRIDPQGILPSTRFDDAQPPKKLTGGFADSKATTTPQPNNQPNPLLSIPINQ